MDELDKRMLAKKARELASNHRWRADGDYIQERIHEGIAESWDGFADLLERELPPHEARS